MKLKYPVKILVLSEIFKFKFKLKLKFEDTLHNAFFTFKYDI